MEGNQARLVPRCKNVKTQAEAIKFGQVISRNHRTELIIHDRNGRLQERMSYSTDSPPYER